MTRLLLVCLCHSQAFSQSVVPVSPEFVRTLGQVLAMVKVGTVPQINPATGAQVGPPMPAAFVGEERPGNLTLPGGLCGATEVFYSCIWEAKPNKYSVAVLLDSITADVSAALPESFIRTKDQTTTQRFAVFTDPAKEISVTITCPATDTDLVLPSYTVTLKIHPSALRMR